MDEVYVGAWAAKHGGMVVPGSNSFSQN